MFDLFLENAKQIDNILKILELFYNFLDQKYFLYFDEQILRLLTRYILNYSFVVTNEMVTNGPSPKLLNELQLKEIRACVQLIEKLIDHLADIASINHVVLCLCELIDLANNTIPKDSMVSVTLIYEVQIDLGHTSLHINFHVYLKVYEKAVGQQNW